MDEARFPLLEDAALGALELLDTPVHIYSFDSEAIAWANQRALKFWAATTVDELRNRQLTPFSDATSRRLEAYRKAFRRGEVFNETWTVYPKGVPAPATVRVRGVSLDGHPEAMLCETRLFKPQDLPADELRAMEALRHSPTMISMLSDDGEVLLRNPAASEFFSKNVGEQANGIEALKTVFAEQSDFDWLAQTASARGLAESTIRTSGPNPRVHSVQVTRMTDPVSGKLFNLWVQQDVSELSALTQELADSEAALDVVLGLNAAPILVVSAVNGGILKANFAARRIFDVEDPACESRACIFAEKEASKKFLEEVLSEGSCSRTGILRGKGGRTFLAAVTGSKLGFGQEAALIWIVNDIDQWRRAAEELEVALNYEREITTMQRSVLAVAAHEFRTPLAVIDGAAQRLCRQAEQLQPEQIAEVSNRIRKFVSQLSKVLENTIEKAKQNLLDIACVPVPGSLSDLLRDISGAFEGVAEIDIERSVDELPVLAFDPDLLRQAIVNLIENSIKYAQGSPRIQVFANWRGDVAEIFLRDWGIGIPVAEREVVFLESVRGSNVGARPGNGIGLSVVKKILIAHGGDLEIVDTSGPGLTMKASLPLNR